VPFGTISILGKEVHMDTEAIAIEIVRIRNRISEIDEELEGSAGTDADDEKKHLHERMRRLQDQLAGKGSPDDDRGESDKMQFIAPG
jgi:ABC-type phosphate transport system auxiliary subunit